MAADTNKVVQYHDGSNDLPYGVGETTGTVNVGGIDVYLQSASIAAEGDVKPYKDNVGKTVALVIPETYQTINCSGLVVNMGSGELPTKGEEVANLPELKGMRTGVKWRLESFNVDWQNEDVAKVSMTVRSYTF